MARLLVVDDERSMRELLEILLGKEGHVVDVAADGPSAIAAFEQHRHPVVLTDLMLGRSSGLDVLRSVKATGAPSEVIVMTAYSTTEGAIQAMKLGAYDYVTKPFKVDELQLLVQKALEKSSLVHDNAALRQELEARGRLQDLVGHSPAMKQVFGLIEKVAPTRANVLVTGESGVGKELVAKALHQRSPRCDQPFVPVNCGAIPEGLIESELFGHVRGAFTGAQADKAGLFTAAGGGTLFLDEIGELPLLLQVKLLRAIQDRRIRPVGATDDVEIDVRIIAATNRDLAAEVRAGRFREDLFYRLNVIQIRVPPLRERREDVLRLAEHFLRRFAAEHGRGPLSLSRETRRLIDEYAFPGNVRELENLIERAVTLSDGPEVTMDALPLPLRPPMAASALLAEGPLPQSFSLEKHLTEIEQSLIERALHQSGGVKKSAASYLGLTFRQFRHRYKKLFGEKDDAGDDEGGE